MITIYPEFYNRFICKADKCNHTCCAGWEIDIDEETQKLYKSVEGEFGDELRSSMVGTDDTVSFKMKDNRCPFLNENNLCRIILKMGEDALSDICALHPRFYEDINEDYELFGTGLSCEKTCELILEEDRSIEYCAGNDNVRMDISWIVDLAGYDVENDKFDFKPSVSKKECLKIISDYRKTEAIDDQWIQELDDLEKRLSIDEVKLSEYAEIYDKNVFNNIKQYIVYRQIEYMEEYGAETVCEYAQKATQFVFMESAFFKNITEHLRRWSEQIEYSTINVELLLNKAEVIK